MIHPKMKYTYVGIDSHKDTHCAVVLDCFFEKLGEINIRNIPNEFDDFLKRLEKIKLPETKLAFGMEDTTAYGRCLTSFIAERDYIVKHTNSTLVAAERDNNNKGNKTDSHDAECAARVLIMNFNSLPDASSQDKYWVLTNIVARRRSIVKLNTALKNQFHSFIYPHYPSYSKFFKNIDCKTALTFYENYPSPLALKNVTVNELEELLRGSGDKLWKTRAKKIINCVKKDGDTTSEFQEIRNLTIKSIVKQIRWNLKELENIDALLEDFIEMFDYNLQSMKGIDVVTAANLIVEIGDIERFSTPSKLARYSGVAPVTYSSGKNDVKFSNDRGNRILNSIFFKLAVCVTMTNGPKKKIVNPFFYNYYHKKIKEGKTKRQSLKCVQRRLVNIIWGMMKYKRDYINPPGVYESELV